MELKKLRFLYAFLIILYLLIFSIMRYDTFAWFTSQSSASGEITNATTSDLLQINGEIQYGENCQLKSSITIKNISTIDIPLSIERISKNGGTDEISKTLNPNESFTSNPKNPDNQLTDCTTKQVMYHLTALQSYVDEAIVLSVEQEKIKKPVDQGEKETAKDTIGDKKEGHGLSTKKKLEKEKIKGDTTNLAENEPGQAKKPEVEIKQPEDAANQQKGDTFDRNPSGKLQPDTGEVNQIPLDKGVKNEKEKQ
ncbi:hypothetical protein CFK37_15875 [Virgibacillus phasianinus]|uniref:Uncharacterized protein n=1 Tax=Virgibacillus phasianinus TaxID=2017483 RepID=A0A220U6J7_9BACI|nr:hypothetical protein [Virgibacillus phasianinus]ASK63526.1 hypothetical protein CFK37_15875 [Virgibacillus phasianinus]